MMITLGSGATAAIGRGAGDRDKPSIFLDEALVDTFAIDNMQ
jgi:hypothetical protein